MLEANWISNEKLEKTISIFKNKSIKLYNILCSKSDKPYDYQEDLFDSIIRNFLTRKYENIQISGSRQTGKTYMSEIFITSSLLCLPHLLNEIKKKKWVKNFNETFKSLNNNFAVIVPGKTTPLYSRVKSNIDKLKGNKGLAEIINLKKIINNKNNIRIEIGVNSSREIEGVVEEFEIICSTSVDYVINKKSEEKQGPTCTINFFDEAQVMRKVDKENSFDPTLVSTNGFSVIMGKGIEDNKSIMKAVKIDNSKIKIKELETGDKEGFKNLFHNTYKINKINKKPVIPDDFKLPDTLGVEVPIRLDDTQMKEIILKNNLNNTILKDFLTNFLALDLTLIERETIQNKYSLFLKEYPNKIKAENLYKVYKNLSNTEGFPFLDKYFIGIDWGLKRSSTVVIILIYLEKEKNFLIIDLMEFENNQDNESILDLEEKHKHQQEQVDKVYSKLKFFIEKQNVLISCDYHSGVSEALTDGLFLRHFNIKIHRGNKKINSIFRVYYGNEHEKKKQFNNLYEIMSQGNIYFLPQNNSKEYFIYNKNIKKLNNELSRLKLEIKNGEVEVKYPRKLDSNKMDLTDALRYSLADFFIK